MFEAHAGIGGAERPVDALWGRVAVLRPRGDRGLRGDRVCRVRTLRSGSALWSQRPCLRVNAWRRASSGGNVQGGRDRCVRPALALRTLVALQQARTRSLFHPAGRWRPPRLLAIRGATAVRRRSGAVRIAGIWGTLVWLAGIRIITRHYVHDYALGAVEL